MYNYEMQSYGIYDNSRNAYTVGRNIYTDRSIFVDNKRAVYDQEVEEKRKLEKAEGEQYNVNEAGYKKMTHALTRKDLKEARENFLAEEGYS